MDLADTVAEVGTSKQLQIKPRLGFDYLKINRRCVCQICCSFSEGSSSGQNYVALWSNLAGSITLKYKAEVTGVCVKPQSSATLTVYDTILTLSPTTYLPFENGIKRYVLRFACGAHLCEHHRSSAEVRGGGLRERVRGAHMEKESRGVARGGLDRLPLLLGRPASPGGLSDLINHFLSSMRSPWL